MRKLMPDTCWQFLTFLCCIEWVRTWNFPTSLTATYDRIGSWPAFLSMQPGFGFDRMCRECVFVYYFASPPRYLQAVRPVYRPFPLLHSIPSPASHTDSPLKSVESSFCKRFPTTYFPVCFCFPPSRATIFPYLKSQRLTGNYFVRATTKHRSFHCLADQRDQKH